MRSKPLSVAEEVRRASMVVLLGLAIAATIAVSLITVNLVQVQPLRERYEEAARSVRLAHAAMIDQQTGLRGYVVTRDERFLEAYQRGKDALPTHSREATAQLADTGSMTESVVALRVAQERWLSFARPLSDSAPARTPAELKTLLDREKSLFDTYRATEATLERLVDGRRREIDHRQRAYLVAAAVATILTGVAAGAVGLRRFRRLRRSIVGPVEATIATIDRIGMNEPAGALPDAPIEFRRIASGLAGLAATLAARQTEAELNLEAARHHGERLTTILGMAREISGSLSVRYVLRAVVASAVRVSGFGQVVVWMLDEDRNLLVATGDDASALLEEPAEIGAGLVGHSARFARPMARRAGYSARQVEPDVPLDAMAFPLVVGAAVVGVVEFRATAPVIVDREALEALETLCIHGAAALEAARLHEHIAELSRTDALTRLPNRRAFDSDLHNEVERSKRYQRPLCLLMIDVDHFKNLNDRWGHQRGDEVLQEIARVLAETLRGSDTVYRYGGEELAVLARETTHAEGALLAERLRARIEKHFPEGPDADPVTASFGVSTWHEGMDTHRDLVSAADSALYQAKADGRNRVAVAAQTAATTAAVPDM
ncbi:MAG: diguanylate cyclase [Ilumatobacteraceae bacterium]